MIFVDTSFWVALRNTRDPHHSEASKLARNLKSPLLTTNHVVGETWTFLRRRAGHNSAVHFLETIGRSRRLVVEHVPPDLEDKAFRWLRRHNEREYSFVDATSFQIMQSSRIESALAFDGDFSAAGFIEVRI